MATFITTIKFTEQGIKAIGETTKRANAFKAAAKKMGVKVKEIYWTLGAFDGAIVFDAADDETGDGCPIATRHIGQRSDDDGSCLRRC